MRVVVLGFDGASPKLIGKWIDYLPTFRRLKEKGVFGQTIPPYPAQTPVAWTTFMTGKDPGKHGIFSFAMRKMEAYDREIIEPSLIKSKTLWSILSANGKKVGVINVPMTDAEKLNGFIIPGFLSRTEGTPSPDNIRKKVQQHFGIERLDGDVETKVLRSVEDQPDLFFERVNQITDRTARVSQYLLQKEDWDFFMAVFMGADRIQHFFWKFVDSSHPMYTKSEFTQLVAEYYVKIDGIIKDFEDQLDKDTTMIILSDHGFCSVNKEVFVNNYLEDFGFLEERNGKIDFENSKAVSYGYGDVWLNVKGREPHGIVDRAEYDTIRSNIISRFKRIRIDGNSLFKEVKRREDIYFGDYLRRAPDLLAIFNPGWQAARHPAISTSKGPSKYVNSKIRWSGGHDGTHDPEDVPGVLAITGSRIHESRHARIRLRDFAPTILNLFNISVPDDMDGESFQL